MYRPTTVSSADDSSGSSTVAVAAPAAVTMVTHNPPLVALLLPTISHFYRVNRPKLALTSSLSLRASSTGDL